jgi:hypothetical protein
MAANLIRVNERRLAVFITHGRVDVEMSKNARWDVYMRIYSLAGPKSTTIFGHRWGFEERAGTPEIRGS